MTERDNPERDEREQREPGDAAQRNHDAEQRHRAPPVVATAHGGTALFRRELREVRYHADERERGNEHGHHCHEAADEPQPDNELARYKRTERVTRVAAGVEVRHTARTLPPAGVRRELRAFGMERRDAEAAREDEQQHDGVGRRDGRAADADRGEHGARRNQPERAPAI